jgi:hypothetical protein
MQLSKSPAYRIVTGSIFGAIAGAIWIALSILVSSQGGGQRFHDKNSSFAEFIVSSLIFFGLIFAIFVIIGIPAYLMGKVAGFNKLIPGVILGFVLGMLGSVGFGIDASPRNLLYGASTFGVAGILAAAIFLWQTQEWLIGRAALEKKRPDA